MRNSTRIQDQQRAGRAPYNFVPLPDEARYLASQHDPPPQDRYDLDLFTGELEVQWTAVSDFYIRGMWDLDRYLKMTKNERDERKVTTPFLVNGLLRLPGTSVRGMIRNIIEIIGEAPLDPVNDQQLFFRAVAATANPSDRAGSYEPQAESYKKRVFKAEAFQGEGVQAGYLTGGRDGWRIIPALRVDGFQCFQERVVHGTKWAQRRGEQREVNRDLTDEPEKTWVPPAEVWFQHTALQRANVTPQETSGWHRGVKVSTGRISSKVHQWVICAKDPNAKALPIPEADVAAYLETGISQELRHHPAYVYSESSKDAPCFYVQWQDASGRAHVTFGHTHFLKIPYVHTLATAVPEKCRRASGEKRCDLAQALFGRTDQPGRSGARGRLFFEDALLHSAPNPAFEAEERRVVLGQPKPTTWQHYAVQTSQEVKPNGRDAGATHWDGDNKLRGQGYVRGHKLYWHRIGAPIPEPLQKQDNVASRLRPARADCVFRQRIRFENLRDFELGGLLTTLMLPKGCGHKLGMGKPLGFGSFECAVLSITLLDPLARHSRFFASSGRLATGKRICEPQDRDRFWSAFAEWITREKSATWSALWAKPRMQELRCMLSLRPLPDLAAGWFDRTRYLVIERQFANGKKNEYDNVSDARGVALMQKRRPLPPASQVYTDAKMPSDAVIAPSRGDAGARQPGGDPRGRR